ncbi:hypothetical protein JCM9533A_07640 [Catenuloplanes niger JCM 9533]
MAPALSVVQDDSPDSKPGLASSRAAGVTAAAARPSATMTNPLASSAAVTARTSDLTEIIHSRRWIPGPPSALDVQLLFSQ